MRQENAYSAEFDSLNIHPVKRRRPRCSIFAHVPAPHPRVAPSHKSKLTHQQREGLWNNHFPSPFSSLTPKLTGACGGRKHGEIDLRCARAQRIPSYARCGIRETRPYFVQLRQQDDDQRYSKLREIDFISFLRQIPILTSSLIC